MNKTTSGTRPYEMRERARSAAANGERILSAARDRFSRMMFDEVTLNDIAEDAGVSVQTVIRRFGSKEQLFTKLAEIEAVRVLAERDPDDGASVSLEQILKTLIDHYERDGRTVLNLIAQESRFPVVAEVVAQGRRLHEEWVAEHCGSVLGAKRGRDRERRLMAAVAATDLSTWKLLRLDRGLSRREVIETMATLLEGLNETGER
jgi:AcrR family transcriptional regulator